MNYQLTISCSKGNLVKVRQFVTEVLENHHLKEIEAHKLVLAVDEVCANLIIHSNLCNPDHHIEVLVSLEPGKEVIFTIRDQGIEFDITSYSEPSMEEIVSSKRKGGVGLMLVKRIMDKIEFSTDQNYNICRLTKKLDQ